MKPEKKEVEIGQNVLFEQLALKRLREIEVTAFEKNRELSVRRSRWRALRRIGQVLRAVAAFVRPQELEREVAPGAKRERRHEWERVEARFF